MAEDPLSPDATTRSLALLDELMADAWPPKVVERAGSWRMRWSDGATRRACSALAGPTDDLIGMVERVETFYAGLDQPSMLQVTTASAPAGLVELLGARGYTAAARTLVQFALTTEVLARSSAPGRVTVCDEVTEPWFDAYWTVSGPGTGPDHLRAAWRSLLSPSLPTAFVAAHAGHEVVGVGQVVLDRGWGGIQCMAVLPTHRRRGVAASVLASLASAAAASGAARLYLGVMANNHAARTLYERAGFNTAHEYRYFAR